MKKRANHFKYYGFNYYHAIIRPMLVYVFLGWIILTMFFVCLVNSDPREIRLHGGPIKLWEQFYYQYTTLKDLGEIFIKMF